MTCKEAERLIALCYYGELDEAESNAMRLHLESCESCRAEFAAVRKMLRGIIPPEVPEMPERFWRENAARIIRRVEAPAASRSHPVWLWYAAAAAIVVCLLGLSIALRSHRQPGVDGTIVVESREPEWDQSPPKTPAGTQGIDAAQMPVLVEVEADIEIESVDEALTGFWDEPGAGTEGADGFNAEFEKTLESLEGSIDELMLELDLT